MENYPEGSESQSLCNIRLLNRQELRLILVSSTNRHTNSSCRYFDPTPLTAHVNLSTYFMSPLKEFPISSNQKGIAEVLTKPQKECAATPKVLF